MRGEAVWLCRTLEKRVWEALQDKSNVARVEQMQNENGFVEEVDEFDAATA